MIQLAYLSSATSLFSPDELAQILTKSRANNSRRNITGMLLYKGGNVLQVIEGEKAEVQSLFNAIGRDPRHNGVIRLYEKEITDRDFPEWTMGFQDLDAEEARTRPGFSDFLDPHFDLQTLKPSAASKLMSVFKSNVR